MYELKVPNGTYKSNNLFWLFFTILRHRLHHLVKDGKYMDQMKHLKEQNTTYFRHLAQAWVMGVVLFIHGVIPWILTDWVSKRICNGTD